MRRPRHKLCTRELIDIFLVRPPKRSRIHRIATKVQAILQLFCRALKSGLALPLSPPYTSDGGKPHITGTERLPMLRCQRFFFQYIIVIFSTFFPNRSITINCNNVCEVQLLQNKYCGHCFNIT